MYVKKPERILQVRDLNVGFPRGGERVLVVAQLSFDVVAGQTLAIVGESGSGKTVCCRALLGLAPRGAQVWGSVLLGSKELIGLPERDFRRHRGRDLALIFQNPEQALNPTMRVGDQISEAIAAHSLDRGTARAHAVQLLRTLRLPDPEGQLAAYPHELSGGMQQRVAIAMALASRPRVLIADEVTRSVDSLTQIAILRLLAYMQKTSGMAVVMVTHDVRIASLFCDHVLVMHKGTCVEYGPTARVLHAPRSPYARALFGVERTLAASNQ